MHPLHGNPYSLTLISIDGHLHSPLIRLVDVSLSSPFLSSQPPPYTTIVLCPWLTLMHCVKVERFERIEYENKCLAETGVVHDMNILCDEEGA